MASAQTHGTAEWTADERRLIESLWIGNLPELPRSPGNPVADDTRAVALGHRLFFDARLSRTGTVACVTCHQPARNFKDGLARGRGIGETDRKTMSVVGAAYSSWLFWDGRRDSLWAQALEPLEHPDEHGGTRLHYAHLIAGIEDYRQRYEALFGALPDLDDRERFPLHAGPLGSPAERRAWQGMRAIDRERVSTVFANIGRALEAYQRRLVPAASPFDRYVEALRHDDAGAARRALSEQAESGLRLFVGEAQCIHCHNGPLFTNHEFHNTGLFPSDALPVDRGRIDGVKHLQADEFNCLGPFAGNDPGDCAELRFVKYHGAELVAAFRTPSLRNVAGTGPWMHDGAFSTLREVLEHYNEATPTLISDELEPLALDDDDLDALETFLHALDGPLATDPELLRQPERSTTP